MTPSPADRTEATVGRVLGTEDATPLAFHVALAPDRYLQLDDVVSVTTAVPGAPEGQRQVVISGVVSQVRARHEGARFTGDVFLAEDGAFPLETARTAVVRTTRIHHPGRHPSEPTLTVPPMPGAPVVRADQAERDLALHFDEMTEGKLPAGLGRDGGPVVIDASFVDGTRGAHVNISGISGVATKTSYALFLLYGLLHSTALAQRHNATAVVFNVKGEDLLHVDTPNARRPPETAEQYRKLDLCAPGAEPTPFQRTRIWAPIAAGARATGPDSQRQDGVWPYYWTVREFVAERLLPFVFLEADDERSQIADLVQRVADLADRLHEPVEVRGSERTATCRLPVPPPPPDPEQAADGDEAPPAPIVDELRPITSFDDLIDYLDERLHDPADSRWRGNMAAGTVEGFMRRLRAARVHMGHLIRGDGEDVHPGGHRIEEVLGDATGAGTQVAVVDINALHDRAKRFVVGAVLAGLIGRREGRPAGAPLFIVLDELNRYAPREGSSPIKEALLDIAERGRSLGLILIGAQQTASEVERRVVGNASIRVTGRMDAAEAARAEYGYMDETARQRSLLLQPGAMLLLQPRVPVPLEVRFPFPAWATRRSERAPDPVAADQLARDVLRATDRLDRDEEP